MPDGVDQPIDGDDLVPVKEQHRQDDPLLAPAELNLVALVVVDPKGAEYAEVHALASTLTPSPQDANAARSSRFEPVDNPARGASTQSTASGGRDERKSMSMDRRLRVLRLFSLLVVAAALAAPMAASAADGSSATLRNDEAHYGRPSASQAPSRTVLNDMVHSRNQGAATQQTPAAVSFRSREASIGSPRASAPLAEPGSCSSSASPLSHCADASNRRSAGLTPRGRSSTASEEGGLKAALFIE